MTQRIVHRPARDTRPMAVPEPIVLDGLPELDQGRGGMNMMALIPLLGAATSVTVMMLFRGSSLAGIGAPMMVATVLASVVMIFTQRGKASRTRQEQRIPYMAYLRRQKDALHGDQEAARQRANLLAPRPALLGSLIRDPHRLWERRRADPDFLSVRIGTGTTAFRQIVIPESQDQVRGPDPFMLAEAQQLRQRFESAPDMPLLLPISRCGHVSIVGTAEDTAAVARVIACSLASLQSPEDVQLALISEHPSATHPENPTEGLGGPPVNNDPWGWFKWLPHARSTPHHIRARSTAHELAAALHREIAERVKAMAQARRNVEIPAAQLFSRLVVISNRHGEIAQELPLPEGNLAPGDLGITQLHLLASQGDEPEHVDARIVVNGPDVVIEDVRSGTMSEGRLETLGGPDAESLCRALSPLRLAPESYEHSEERRAMDFSAALGLDTLDLPSMSHAWADRPEAELLRVTLGVDDRGNPTYLDMKESALHGMGPHGLCVGATGSGKSELLRALVLSLVATHAPTDLNLVLIDYKGGATFAPFSGIPHLSGLVTNLSDDASLVDRVFASLSGEVRRRQQFLKDAGDFASINDYRRHRRNVPAGRNPPEALPHLIVVIDEFAELLTARPDFVDLFLSIGRIGRSIGVHLLLSSRRIEAGMMRGLDTYLSYRIGLRTLSESESRTVLETPDAFSLPAAPGYGYLKVDTSIYTRFKSHYVSGSLPLETMDEDSVLETPNVERFVLMSQAEAGAEVPGVVRLPDSGTVGMPTLLGTVIDQLRQSPRATAPVWLPPLVDSLTPDDAVPLSFTSAGPRFTGQRAMVPVIGTLDETTNQWQGPWELDLTAGGGHLAIIGGPQTGKSTTLRTVAAALALSREPAQVNFFGIDLQGSALTQLNDFPHTSGVAGCSNKEYVRRAVEEVIRLLELREQVFERRGIDSLNSMRSSHAAGKLPELASSDVVLFIDGYGALNTEFEYLEKDIHALLARGSNYGIHLVLSLARWNELRLAQQSHVGSRIEFGFSDSADSIIDRKLSASMGTKRPGRALTSSSRGGRRSASTASALLGQVALPRMDGEATSDGIAAATQSLAHTVTYSFPDACAPKVRVLPTLISVPRNYTPKTRGTVPLGISESELATEELGLFGNDCGLIVLGDAQSGKANLLSGVASSLMGPFSADELVFGLFDPRNSLRDHFPEAFRGAVANTAVLAARLAQSIAGQLAKRMQDGVQAADPHIVLLIDDYDILVAGGQHPLAALDEFIPSAADLLLHVVLSRRVAGASLGMHEPFIAALRNSGTPTIMFSGEPSEGPVVGALRPMVLPPGRARLIRTGRAPTSVQSYIHSLDPEAGPRHEP